MAKKIISLEKIIDEQFALTSLSRSKNKKHEHGILICLDDFSDDPNFMRNNALLNKLYVRGRHAQISIVTAVHRLKSIISPLIRAQATALMIFKQRNFTEFQNFIDDYDAVVDKKTLDQIYHTAVDQPYQFLYIDLTATDVNEMFDVGFQSHIRVSP